VVDFSKLTMSSRNELVRLMYLIETDNVHLLTDAQIQMIPQAIVTEICKLSNSIEFTNRVNGLLKSSSVRVN